MSFIPFQQACKSCGKSWNAVFGIVGTSYIGGPPVVECPHCGSSDLEKIADGWKMEEKTVDKPDDDVQGLGP